MKEREEGEEGRGKIIKGVTERAEGNEDEKKMIRKQTHTNTKTERE